MVQKYLGLYHSYEDINCITLIKNFYFLELNLQFSLPDYPVSRHWIKQFTTTSIDSWAAQCAKKVSLTNAKDYDVIAFKSEKTNLVIHFGMYLMPSKMLHIEEGGISRVETLSDYWIESIHSIYRHDSLVS
tara:strand:- start:117 stop:509 length:393 start_codon:yes stop_codon:yes gene_type:complete